MFLLLFGIVVILVCLLLIILYVINLKSVCYLYELKIVGKKILIIMDDLCSLLNECFYVILMMIFLLGVFFFIILLLLYMILIVFINYDYNYLLLKNFFIWVGLVNLGNVIIGDMVLMFFLVFGWILIWVVFVIVICFFFGIILVLFINIKGLKYKVFWWIIFVIMMVVFLFVLFLIMWNFLNGFGFINVLLLNWGLIDFFIFFLIDLNWVKLIIIVVNMWIGIFVMMLIFIGII